MNYVQETIGMNFVRPTTGQFIGIGAVKLYLPKSFKMMKLLNRNHGTIVRGLAASIAYVGIYIVTGRPILARELAGRFWTKNDFKLGARRGAWYCRRSWLGIDVSLDDYFDPTEGMTDAHLDELEYYIIARRPHLEPMSYRTDRAFIAARRLNNNNDLAERWPNILSFKRCCDALLMHAGDDVPSGLKPRKRRQGDFPIEDAKQSLADFLVLFPLEKMPWFLVSGSFLGLIRENGFLPHDYDIDIGVFEDEIDIDATIAAVAASDRFVLKKYDHHTSSLFGPEVEAVNPDIPYILKLVHVSGVHIDLFIHYRDTHSSPASYWHGSSLHRWNNSPFDLKTYDFYDMQVLGPVDADTYLTENYGDWRTPVTEFNCTTDTPNLVLMPHPVAVVIFLKRYVIARRKGHALADGLQAELIHNGFLKVESGQLRFSSDRFSVLAS